MNKQCAKTKSNELTFSPFGLMNISQGLRTQSSINQYLPCCLQDCCFSLSLSNTYCTKQIIQGVLYSVETIQTYGCFIFKKFQFVKSVKNISPPLTKLPN